ncbi:pyridoxamine 5'-phosphate oxidase family protein [Rhodococcus jostii]|uniref:Nitroimidazol reductase NimA, pyridoxamine 5'-phosphate oxidase superfamily n=1 Tax=Rhodococcus jostii TaxID=132919 RepID=A0A1H4TQD1_RHOJO|nr:pyridoxamine 5'-phosphate oxidase family protein [Rhodococcus jostii]SEC58281.1 Nitroimidazol reductase NimA, pyridoxamine 5'-phosphate oxidase superfamily [Rhodococcus jostii]
MANGTDDAAEQPITELTAQESWELLSSGALGRLASTVSGRVDIFPVNYVVHEGKVYFRTAEGSKLVELTINRDVAFEVDEIAEKTGWSVIVHGTARRLQKLSEVAAADELPLRSWLATPKFNYVEITPTEITGRRLVFGDEPDH